VDQFSPAQVERCFELLRIPARFSAEEGRDLSSRTLRVHDGYVGFPTPQDNRALSVLGLRRILGVDPASAPCFFDHPWYLEESFARETCSPGWHVMRIEPLADSLNQPVYHAEDLKRRSLYLPTAVEVVLALFLYYLLRGERLLMRKHTWTSNRTLARRFVSVGAFVKKGLFVSSHEVGYTSRGLGICPVMDPRSEEQVI
jgi:hypothetical protein